MDDFCWCDLHCDTLERCMAKGKPLAQNDGQLDLARGNAQGAWVQVFACWIDAPYRGEAAFARFLRERAVLARALESDPARIRAFDPAVEPEPGCCQAVLAVEGGHALAGRLGNIERMAGLGVRFLTLTWNGDNELGSGALPADGGLPNRRGLTPFGRECVPELERCGILPDISHLNEAGVDDVFTLAKGPIVATHSNLRAVCDNPRNLSDRQFAELVRRGGLCGLNFYPPFVAGGSNYAPESLRRHLDRMLALGGEDCVCLGSDFDGAVMPGFLSGVESLYSLYGIVVEWVGKKAARKLFWENALRFLKENIRPVPALKGWSCT